MRPDADPETSTRARASLAGNRAGLAARFPVWQPQTMDAAFSRLASEFADRLYVLGEDAALTYAEVDALADAYARGMAVRGVRSGDHVGLLMANHPDFVPLAWAVWRLSAVLVPLNFAFREAELAYVLRQSDCRLLIAMASFRDTDYCAMLDAVAPGWERGRAESHPELSAVVLHGAHDRNVSGIPDLAADGRRPGRELPEAKTDPLSPAIVMYTSGTTGRPKGVIQTHDALLRSSFGLAWHMGYADGRRTLFSVPLYHSFGLIFGVVSSIWVGGAVIPQLVFDPERTFRDIERHEANFALFVPTMVLALLEHPARGDYDFSSLSGVHCGAAQSPARLWRKMIDLFGLDEVFTGYGMTEVTCASIMTSPDDPLELFEESVGRVMEAGIAGPRGLIGEYRTVDPYTLEFLPQGEEGELVFRGPVATPGYYKDPERTAEIMLPGGWMRSGDLGRRREDGTFVLTGRSRELYKTGGELVAPREVEAVLDAHPDVAQSYVIGIPDERWGEIGGAYVVPATGATPNPETLQDWCRERLAKYKWPRHVFVVAAEDLPTTPTGKVQKFELVRRARAALATQGADT